MVKAMQPIIQTYSGRMIHLERPAPSDITLEDIAHALSNVCRFGGHSRVFYSVAQHSVLVADMVPPELRLVALLHDAAEAYVGDVTKPLKHLLRGRHRQIEQGFEFAIGTDFGVDLCPLPAAVKHADLRALKTEARDVMGGESSPWDFPAGLEPHPDAIIAWPPDVAKSRLMEAILECWP